MSSSVSGQSALAVAPLSVLLVQRPFGSDTVPALTSGVMLASQWTSPSSLKIRTTSPSAIARGWASCGLILSLATDGLSSPSVDEIVCSLAGEISDSGNSAVAGSVSYTYSPFRD